MTEWIKKLQLNNIGLIPAIAQQHDTGEVLMMAWMSRESIEKTIITKRVWYWSRSRQALWQKGETTGHVQHLVEIRVDCDFDTLLLLVDQTGFVCHTGAHNCFFTSVEQDIKENKLKN